VRVGLEAGGAFVDHDPRDSIALRRTAIATALKCIRCIRQSFLKDLQPKNSTAGGEAYYSLVCGVLYNSNLKLNFIRDDLLLV
jgi:hypothetical protein